MRDLVPSQMFIGDVETILPKVVLVLPVIMFGSMMIDMSISSSGIMLIETVPPMIGACADDVGDDRGGRQHVNHATDDGSRRRKLCPPVSASDPER